MEHMYPKLLQPSRLWSRAEILSDPSPIPRSAGVYAWYFREIPPEVPADGCLMSHGLTLLYIGISPRAPSRNGRHISGQTLNRRIRDHMRGNAEASTLRLTLGCLLSTRLGIELRRVRSRASAHRDSDRYRYTFTKPGEVTLNDWLERNAFVAWMVNSKPWKIEEALIRTVSVPLNLDQNLHHSFLAILSDRRKVAKQLANELPVVLE